MARTSIVDSFLIYNFLRRLTLPFDKWEAYRTGVIDKEGKILIQPKDRTPVQARSLKLFDVLVLNVKKMLAKIPGGSSRFASFSAALFLLREGREPTEEEFVKFIADTIDRLDSDEELRNLHEDVTNAVGTGKIAGLDGDPPVGNLAMLKRSRFAGCTVFDVDYDKVMRCRYGKRKFERYSRSLGDDDVAQQIREYCLNNPKESIILRDEKTGEMIYYRKK